MYPKDGSANRLDDLLPQEWLTVNHVGGYASSTVPSLNTRKYHGLLVAAMAPPGRRLVLLSRVEEVVRAEGWPTPLACCEYPDTIHPDGHLSLRAFSPDPFPRWAYQGDGWSIEKTLQLLRGQNTVVLTYTLLGAKKPVELDLRPLFALRPIHEVGYQWNGKLEAEEKLRGHWRIPATMRSPEVFFAHRGSFSSPGTWYFNTIYRCESERGYAGLEDLWSAGVVSWTLKPGESVQFVCSTDPIDFDRASKQADDACLRLDEPIVPLPIPRDTDHDLLVRAAERFVLDCDAPALVTRFPWSPPSVRESLIALPGILLVTGKFDRAKAILQAISKLESNGRLPDELPENGAAPVGESRDGGYWFVNAVWHYFRYTADETTTRRLLDSVLPIVRVEPDDSIDQVALSYSAIRIAADLSDRFGLASDAASLTARASSMQKSFNARFANDAIVNNCVNQPSILGTEDDDHVRVTELLAIGLPFAILDPSMHARVLDRVRRDLLTPVGLRTLSPRDPQYVGRYYGDVIARDRASNSGCVHPWLLGLFVTATLRVYGRSQQTREEVRTLLDGCFCRMRGEGLGQLPELFDGDAPYCAGGAIASALSVGELLRCYVEDVLDQAPMPTASLSRSADLALGCAKAHSTI